MNETFGGGYDMTAGQGVGGAVQSSSKPEGIIPVVIKQILDSSDDGLILFGMKFGMLTIVGIVRSVEHSSTKITYKMEDHTGQIDAHFWLEEGDALNSPQIVVNTYARIYGSIRQQGGTKTLMIFKIESLLQINDITTHILEVINGRYKAEEFSQSSIGGQGGGGGGFDTFNNGAITNGSNNNMDMDVDRSGFKGNRLMVYKAIKNHVSDEGISLTELQRSLPKIGNVELQDILEFMTTEGHVYTSIDPDHFLCTDAI